MGLCLYRKSQPVKKVLGSIKPVLFLPQFRNFSQAPTLKAGISDDSKLTPTTNSRTLSLSDARLTKLRKALSFRLGNGNIFSSYQACDISLMPREEFLKILWALTDPKTINLRQRPEVEFCPNITPVMKILIDMAHQNSARSKEESDQWAIPLDIWNRIFRHFDQSRQAGNLHYLLGVLIHANFSKLREKYGWLLNNKLSGVFPEFGRDFLLNLHKNSIFKYIEITPTMLNCYFHQCSRILSYRDGSSKQSSEAQVQQALELCHALLPSAPLHPTIYLAIFKGLQQEYINYPQFLQKGYDILLDNMLACRQENSTLFDGRTLNYMYISLMDCNLSASARHLARLVSSEKSSPAHIFRPDINFINKYMLQDLIPPGTNLKETVVGLDQILARWRVHPNYCTMAHCLRGKSIHDGNFIQEIVLWFSKWGDPRNRVLLKADGTLDLPKPLALLLKPSEIAALTRACNPQSLAKIHTQRFSKPVPLSNLPSLPIEPYKTNYESAKIDLNLQDKNKSYSNTKYSNPNPKYSYFYAPTLNSRKFQQSKPESNSNIISLPANLSPRTYDKPLSALSCNPKQTLAKALNSASSDDKD